MLKFRYDKETDIPAESKALYENRDGAWFLKVEGGVEKSKLDEFRENNRKLHDDLKALKDSLAGLDLTKAKELLAKQQELDDKELIKKGDVDKVIENRVKTMRAEMENKITELTAKLDRSTGQLTILTVDNAVTAEAVKKGIQQTAIPDITTRARSIFKVEDGKPVAKSGDQVIFGRDGTTPLSITEWVEKQTTEAPHLFVQNQGGGAGGSGAGGAGGTSKEANPWKKDSFNLTKQMKLTKENPTLAKQMQTEAGLKA
jgi:hypothetical protein